MRTSSQPSSALPCRDTAARRRNRVAVVYNQPVPCSYVGIGEDKAVISILEGVVAAHRALDELGYQVTIVPLLPPVEHARDILKSLETDLIFNLFEGFDDRPKTEATIAGVMSELGFTYTGCSPSALALGLDKAKVKDLLQAHGINTPKYQLLTPETVSRFHLSFPCIVKPSRQDASHGLSADSVVSDQASLERQVTGICRAFGGEALVEEFVDGREFNMTVMGNEEATALPISEIVYSLPPGMPRVLTYAAKWEENTVYFDCTTVECPAQIGTRESAMLLQTAVAVFRLVIKHGYARVDMRLDSKGNVQVLEANPNPDITPGSGAARQAAAATMTYPQFIEKLVLMALQKTAA